LAKGGAHVRGQGGGFRSAVAAEISVFTAIAMMMAYVIYHNERFLIEPMNPVWEHY
jgi:hypothetical protein